LRLADLLAIEFMHRREGPDAKFRPDIDEHENIDRRLCDSARTDDKAKLRLLALRADLFLQVELRFSTARLHNCIRFAETVLFGAVALAGIVIGLVFERLFLVDANGEVAIGHVVWLALVVPFIFMIPSFAALLSVLIGDVTQLLSVKAAFSDEDDVSPSLLSRMLSWFAMVSNLCWRHLVQPAVKMAWRLSGTPSAVDGRPTASSAEESRGSVLTFFQTIKLPRPILILGGATLQSILWSALLTTVLIAAWRQAWFDKFDFAWPSQFSVAARLAAVRLWGRPVAWIARTAIPDRDGIRWASGGDNELFDNKATWQKDFRERHRAIPENELQKQMQAEWDTETKRRAGIVAQLREQWSRFLLWGVVVYAWLPRATLLAVMSGILLLHIRGLRPDLTYPYFQNTVSHLLEPPFGFAEDFEERPPVPQGTAHGKDRLDRHVRADADRGPTPGFGPSSLSHRRADGNLAGGLIAETAAGPGHPAEVWMVGYELPAPSTGWKSLMPTCKVPIKDCGELDGNADKRTFLEALETHRSTVCAVVVWLAAPETPDPVFRQFASDMVRRLNDPEGSIIVLTEGERLRTRFGGDPDKVRHHTGLWKEALQKCGVARERIWEYDHTCGVQSERARLEERLSEIWSCQSAAIPSADQKWRLAGRFPEAFNLLRKRLRDLSGAESADELRSRSKQLHQEIHDLYLAEASRFLSFINALNADLPAVAQRAIEQVRGATDAAVRAVDLKTPWGLLQTIRLYCSGLTPRWAIGGALLGTAVAAGGALATIPTAPAWAAPVLIWLAVGGGSAVGWIGGTNLRRLLCKAGLMSASAKSDLPAAPPTTGELPEAVFTIDDIARTNLLWILILELQGNSQADIAEALQKLLNDVAEPPLRTANEVDELIKKLSERLRMLRGREETAK